MQSPNAALREVFATWARHSAPWVLLFFVLFTTVGHVLML